MNTQKQEHSRSAIIYTRTATLDSSDEIHAKQKAECEANIRDISKMLGTPIKIKEHISDNGFSANDECRPGMYSLMDSIHQGDVDFVVVFDCSRLTRSTDTFWEFINFLSERHIDLIVCDASVNGIRVCKCK